MSSTASDVPSRPGDFAYAARVSGVVWAGLFALGIGFGILVVGSGLPWWLAPVISAVVFAGSLEFLLIGMLASATPIATIALTTFLVNSRHLFYGITFPLQRARGRAAKAYSVFALCDEAYAIITTKDPRELTTARMMWIQAGLHLCWTCGAFTGGLLGVSFLREVEGLDFVLTALFIVLALDAYRDRPDRLTLGLAVVAAVVALLVAPGSMLLISLSIYTVALVVRYRVRSDRTTTSIREDAADA